MPIAQNPLRSTSNEKSAKKFIAAAPRENEEDNALEQTAIRFTRELRERIDSEAKRRGLNRSSWIRYALTRVLEEDEVRRA